MEKVEKRRKRSSFSTEELKFLNSRCGVHRRRKSLIMTLEKTTVFYRRNDRPRYTTRISRPISASTPRTQVSCLWEPRIFGILKFASLQESESCVSTLKFTSLQQSKSRISTSMFASLQKVRAASLQYSQVCISSSKWEPRLFSILKFAPLHQSESRVSTSKFASLQQSDSRISTSTFASLQWTRVVSHFRCGQRL